VQIDVANDRQAQLQLEAPYFNPVKLVCSTAVGCEKIGMAG
jgi:hypothetical protein